ncbi:hypothetical protein [Paenibacillus thalictri]|uniref:Uncharacterized protein n=1 Tax=Paenibacillus thalictri TaxID=2527873 RepID=A0A4Q9DX77_9BACL|nr:hypothetical protein [Paenibacillus thalictri]TBL81717.1 hypothetical protein EYB31_01590 [Paenibacillus thalictri]
MVKTGIWVVMLLFYPLFLKLIHIHDLRVVPLVVPYAVGCLAVVIIVSEIVEYVVKKFRT